MNTHDAAHPVDRQYPGIANRNLEPSSHQQFDDTASIAESFLAPLPEPRLPDLDLPQSSFDLTFDSILSEAKVAPEPEVERVQKRASNVLKLAQENEKLMEELRAMNARLEEAERRQQELRQREAQRGTQATAATS